MLWLFKPSGAVDLYMTVLKFALFLTTPAGQLCNEFAFRLRNSRGTISFPVFHSYRAGQKVGPTSVHGALREERATKQVPNLKTRPGGVRSSLQVATFFCSLRAAVQSIPETALRWSRSFYNFLLVPRPCRENPSHRVEGSRADLTLERRRGWASGL